MKHMVTRLPRVALDARKARLQSTANDRILWKPRAPRVRALSRGRGCGPIPNQDQEPANQWNRRALPQNSAERVLPGGVPQAHLRLDGRAARESRRVDQELQRKQTPSGPLVFRQNPNADLP